MPRPASLDLCKSIRRWPALILPAAIGPVAPVVEEFTPVRRERLFCCEHFGLWRLGGESPFTVGAAETPRVLVCIAGDGQLDTMAPLMP